MRKALAVAALSAGSLGFGASSYLNELRLADAVYLNYQLIRHEMSEGVRQERWMQPSGRTTYTQRMSEHIAKLIAKHDKTWPVILERAASSSSLSADYRYVVSASVCCTMASVARIVIDSGGDYGPSMRAVADMLPALKRIRRDVEASQFAAPTYNHGPTPAPGMLLFEKRYGVTLTKPKPEKK
jgi:hypothetical protein